LIKGVAILLSINTTVLVIILTPINHENDYWQTVFSLIFTVKGLNIA